MIEFARHPVAGTPRVGEYWEGQGGIYAGIMPDYTGTSPYHLVLSTDEAVDIKWGPYGIPDDDARSKSDGQANTNTLTHCRHRHPAARWAANYEKDGHADFYLPAQCELEMAAASLPDQFSRSEWYWSSTEETADNAQGANFNGYPLGTSFKSFAGRARAVRKIFVSDSA
ncbi:DUF1566 domain-containing protein [Trinickia dinghuensis]|uniref:DUF1566 domain-containing protein n=1 Tax=Trinickia dinghuensis TaxID=2291023 RepID=A0A3D8JRP9_9BURK|nr:DUF1566 domain-containing protein [Trinickia dinghuensis]RDU95462.1 DUF1566 domain-containing protein [Trinickia dinghuensis]